jgi:phytoene dehydrogenase-like protein
MSERFDVLVVGGGHNGLIAATMLARGGLAVAVLEKEPRVGGALATDEIHPDFHAPATFAGFERFHPAITAELELERHGLRFLEPRGGTLQLLGGGESLHLDPSSDLDATITRRSTDAAALRSLELTRRSLTGALAPLLVEPLARGWPIPGWGGGGKASLGERASDLLLFGRAWRALRGAGLEEALRLLPMNVRDVLDERLTDDALKAALASPALQASFMGPRSAGSFWNLLWQRPAWMPHLLAPPRQAAGGPGALAAALEAAARAAGVVIRAGAAVERITIAGGAVTGAVVEGGDELVAGRVVSALDPRRTLLGLLEPGLLDVEAAAEIGSLRGRGNVAIVRLALDRVPRLGGSNGAALAGRIQTGARLDDLERAYDASKYGRLAERPALEITVPSVADPALAPPGKAVLHAWVQFVPHRPRGEDGTETPPPPQPGMGHNDGDLRAEIERRVLATLDEHDRGLSSSVLAADVLTPATIARRFGLTEGCLYHVEPALDQMLWLRPVLGWHLHSTPVAGLYLAGPGTHPGGGPTGLPGRCAARRVLSDLRAKSPARLRRSAVG